MSKVHKVCVVLTLLAVFAERFLDDPFNSWAQAVWLSMSVWILTGFIKKTNIKYVLRIASPPILLYLILHFSGDTVTVQEVLGDLFSNLWIVDKIQKLGEMTIIGGKPTLVTEKVFIYQLLNLQYVILNIFMVLAALILSARFISRAEEKVSQ